MTFIFYGDEEDDNGDVAEVAAFRRFAATSG